MHKIISFFIIFSFLFNADSSGQNNSFEYSDTAIYKVEESKEEKYEVKNYENAIHIPDTSLVLSPIRELKDSVENWKKEKSLAYLQGLDSLLAREQAKEDAALNGTLDKAEKGVTFIDKLFGSEFFQIFLWFIAAMALFYILYKLFLSKGLFSKTEKEKNNVEEHPEEDLLQLGNYDKLIQEALQVSDYRLATRFLFLQSLKQLSDKEIIFYGADKTNSAYLEQLPGHLKSGFKNIARYYDYIWYGNQTIDKNNFQNVQQIFIKFNQSL